MPLTLDCLRRLAVFFAISASVLLPAEPAAALALLRGVGSTPATSRSPQIIGGSDVADGQYPFMVALLEGTGPGSYPFCGGSLITPSLVMTSARCVSDRVESSGFRVAVGRTVADDRSQGQILPVAPNQVVIHPRYRAGRAEFNVALIELPHPVWGIRPVTLGEWGIPEALRNGTATVTGWGRTHRVLRPFPLRLRQAHVPVLDDQVCQAAYRDAYYPRLNVCAGHQGKGTCEGDGGSPLFRTGIDGRQHQIGIISYGRGCAQGGGPGVYTAVGSRLLWATLGESAEGRRALSRLTAEAAPAVVLIVSPARSADTDFVITNDSQPQQPARRQRHAVAPSRGRERLTPDRKCHTIYTSCCSAPRPQCTIYWHMPMALPWVAS